MTNVAIFLAVTCSGLYEPIEIVFAYEMKIVVVVELATSNPRITGCS